MGAYWSKRIGSDPYYASYERSFKVLKKDIDRIKVQICQDSHSACWEAREQEFSAMHTA